MANKLSNSGDTLKIIILNQYWKVLSGWTNHSERVTSYNMKETEMGYRGSKSSENMEMWQKQLRISGVKEQRVDGSWCFYWSNLLPRKAMQKHLRYTLMGLERGYPVEVLSKQLKRNSSTCTLTSKNYITLDPYFITGFTDAEGSFTVTIYPDKKMKNGIRVLAEFKIGLNEQDLDLLKLIQNYFGGIGNLHYNTTFNSWTYKVSKNKDMLNVIIPHFTKYPLLTQKAADFKLFVEIVKLVSESAHLNKAGLSQIVNIKSTLNKGNTEFVKSYFSQIQPVQREIIETTEIPSPHWIAGFVSGEGNFDAGIRKATENRMERVYLRFRLTQNHRDVKLMELIVNYLGAGRIEWDNRKGFSNVSIVIGNFSDITNKIIPFFDNYPVLGVKALDFLDWVKIADLIKLKLNKTIEGMDKIKKIEKGMNRSRGK
jgi:LAGLIDADG endonuclease